MGISRDGAITERDIDAAVFKNKAQIGWEISIEPVVGQISPNSPAEKSGLQTGDRILNVNGVEIKDWSQVSPTIQQTKGKDSQISILRDKSNLEFSIKPHWNETNRYWVLGIGSQTVHTSEKLVDSFSLGATQVYVITVKTFEFLARLVRGQESTKSMGGPIMIAQMVGQAAQSDFSNLLFLAGFISLQFAVFNLLPIPALDGGHIFFLLVEKIKGSALPKGFRVSVQKAGFSLLLLLILYISIQDGMRIFQGM